MMTENAFFSCIHTQNVVVFSLGALFSLLYILRSISQNYFFLIIPYYKLVLVVV